MLARCIAAVAFLVALQACHLARPPETAPRAASSAQVVGGACLRSFRPSLDAFERRLGRVPVACAMLDKDNAVQVVTPAEFPTECQLGPAELLGCAPPGVVLLRAGLGTTTLIDTSVHEWFHKLLECVFNDPDREHMRANVWGYYGANTAEVQAQAAAQIGECL